MTHDDFESPPHARPQPAPPGLQAPPTATGTAARTLVLPVDFLNSEFAPRVCLYSGRTHKIVRVRRELARDSESGRGSIPVILHVAYGERFLFFLRQRFTPVLIALLALPVLPILQFVLLEWFEEIKLVPFRNISGPGVLMALIISFFAYALPVVGLIRFLQIFDIRWKYNAAQAAMEVIFPRRLHQAQAAYAEALQQWTAAGSPAGDPNPSEEGWTENLSDRWDQAE